MRKCLCLLLLGLGFFPQCTFSETAAYAERDKVILRYFGEGEYAKALSILSSGEESDKPEINFYLGKMFKYGLDVDRDMDRAEKYFLKSSKQGNMNAKIELIDIYTAKNSKESLQKITELNKDLFRILPNMLEDETGEYRYIVGKNLVESETDYDTILKGISLLSSASDDGNIPAQLYLGNYYLSGQHVKKDYEKSFGYFLQAANKGDSDSQYIVGSFYFFGEGVNADIEKGIRWYELAAENGHKQAQYELGYIYAKGKNVEQNLNKALLYLRQASNSGYPGLDNTIKQLDSALQK